MVTVRSSLMIVNKLDVPVEIWAESSADESGVTLPVLDSGSSLPIPVNLVQYSLYARPKLASIFDFCKYRLEWRDVVKPYEGRGFLQECHSQRNKVFRHVVFSSFYNISLIGEVIQIYYS